LLTHKLSSLDAAYERRAMEQGLVKDPVFPENQQWGQPDPIKNDQPIMWNKVLIDCVNRNHMGVKKYGTPLQPFNGRDALKDAYEEALDLVVYLRQAIYERDGK